MTARPRPPCHNVSAAMRKAASALACKALSFKRVTLDIHLQKNIYIYMVKHIGKTHPKRLFDFVALKQTKQTNKSNLFCNSRGSWRMEPNMLIQLFKWYLADPWRKVAVIHSEERCFWGLFFLKCFTFIHKLTHIYPFLFNHFYSNLDTTRCLYLSKRIKIRHCLHPGGLDGTTANWLSN